MRNIRVVKGSSKVSINSLENLVKGIYFLKLSFSNEVETYKIER
jgi:hypothetical protein